MKIVLHNIKIKDLINGYKNNEENGVVGYGGKLDIRPPFQREFVYKGDEKPAVIDTVLKGYPLNIMYWADNGDGTFEIIDGQQRTMSICEYAGLIGDNGEATGSFAYQKKYYHNLTSEEKQKILQYELMVYFCTGTEREKLDWFKVVNIGGKKLSNQELRNAIYCGSWVSDAKRNFSKTKCRASQRGENYLTGSAITQDYLETAIKWACNSKEDDDICDYMARNQHNTSAEPLWKYFEAVIDWVQKVFTIYRPEMKGIEWGFLYNTYKDGAYNVEEMEQRVKALMEDEDVVKKSGIYEYILTGDPKHLQLRAFSEKTKREVFEMQDGICVKCQKTFTIERMQADHIEPWSGGGKTTKDNCQLLCAGCNRVKSNK